MYYNHTSSYYGGGPGEDRLLPPDPTAVDCDCPPGTQAFVVFSTVAPTCLCVSLPGSKVPSHVPGPTQAPISSGSEGVQARQEPPRISVRPRQSDRTSPMRRRKANKTKKAGKYGQEGESSRSPFGYIALGAAVGWISHTYFKNA